MNHPKSTLTLAVYLFCWVKGLVVLGSSLSLSTWCPPHFYQLEWILQCFVLMLHVCLGYVFVNMKLTHYHFKPGSTPLWLYPWCLPWIFDHWTHHWYICFKFNHFTQPHQDYGLPDPHQLSKTPPTIPLTLMTWKYKNGEPVFVPPPNSPCIVPQTGICHYSPSSL